MMRNFHFPGRSSVHGTSYMAASSHPLSTAAAVGILARGGNAVDAAIAASAVLGVVEPEQCGIGGDCFALIAPPGSAPIAVNGSGRAPQAANAHWYLDRGISEINPDTAHAVTVPGAVHAWSEMSRAYGTMALDALLAPAIDLAEHGHAVHERVAWDWANYSVMMRERPELAALYLSDGKPPSPGQVTRQLRLADSLRQIASEGAGALYGGSLGKRLVAHLAGHGGLHSLEDFASHRTEFVTPISVPFGSGEVIQCPPNGQGITTLLMLEMLNGLKRPADPLGIERIHQLLEAYAIAKLERDSQVGDPEFSTDPKILLDPIFVAGLRRRFRPSLDPLRSEARTMGSDTAFVCVVDRERTAVSCINSVFKSFGSGLVAPNTGFPLHNRGVGFVVSPGHPNCIGAGKRPLHTIIPGMMMQGGRPIIVFGMVGGDFQPLGQVLMLQNMVEYGMDPQAAIDFPRVYPVGGKLRIEEGIPETLCAGLSDLGYDLERSVSPIGLAQAIRIDWQNGVLTAGSDGRADGCAFGW
ncbi:gamma-glutamyltranspeptidase/glutathione hydrolase [Rhodoligotrophos appendicifer]|uniref:gamma-glutamyltransferase family protein n=1 Tax=Rhodoligotrophos appendicifer TaxID=987056 RepID=UPI001187115A|nr:gamma-glutamyltransferase family protein [Rhodoligotrophos appendicifer]